MSILTKRLSSLAEDRGLMSNCQGGFRKNRSCIDNVSLLIAKLQNNQKRLQRSHLVFVDIKKAYDSVPQDLLLETLAEHQINPEFLSLLKELYADNKAVVVTVYGDTDPFPVAQCPLYCSTYSWSRLSSGLGTLIQIEIMSTLHMQMTLPLSLQRTEHCKMQLARLINLCLQTNSNLELAQINLHT